jgi:hypothetical protein
VCFSRVSCICRCLLAFVCCVSFRRRVVSRGEMTSTAGQPQFRYTQPPSKVLHVRNLPWECSEEELIELCKPFGKVVNTKVNVGANHNQAFVEFVSTQGKENFSFVYLCISKLFLGFQCFSASCRAHTRFSDKRCSR